MSDRLQVTKDRSKLLRVMRAHRGDTKRFSAQSPTRKLRDCVEYLVEQDMLAEDERKLVLG